jgi:outer membrane protein
MRKVLVLVSVILGASPALGVNLNEALVSAYQNNEDLKKARDTFLNEIEQFPQALAAFLPDIGASVSKSNTKSKAQSRLVPNATASENGTVQQVVSLNQSLFNGGADVANLRAAQSSFRVSRAAYYNSEQSALFGAIQAYVSFYSAEQKYKISDASVILNKKQLDAAEEKLRLGEATQTDVASAMANYSAAEATKLNSYTEYQKAKAEFTRIFGIEPENLVLPEVPQGIPDNLDKFIAKTKAANPAMEAARNNLTAAKSVSYAAKANLLPKVGLTFSAGKNLYEKQNLTQPTLNGLSVTSAITVNMPIYSKGGSDYIQIRKTARNARLAVIGLEAQEKQLISNAIAAFEGYNAGKVATDASIKAVEAAQIAYDGIVQEEAVGSKTILEVLDSEVTLLKYRMQRVDTEANYILAAYQIKSLEGNLTAKSLKLPVKYFEPEKEFKKVKMRIIGD